MRRKIVGVVGRNGSGKDEVVNYLHEQCGITAISAGDIIREIAGKEQISPTRENLHAISEKYMQQIGNDFIARRVIKIIEENNWPAVGIAGVRSPHDVIAFRNYFGNGFRLVHVKVGKSKVRFQRLRKRDEARDPQTWAAFMKQEREEEERFMISRAVEQADLTIDNDGSLSALYRHIEKSPLWDFICPASWKQSNLSRDYNAHLR